MTALFNVANGTPWDASQINQYGSTWNNVFGVTDTNAPNLGRLAAPIATADPGGLTNGMVWLRTNLGLDGRWMTYKNGKTIPLIAMRQRVVVSATGSAITSTSPTDVTGSTITLTTTGGRLHVYCTAQAASFGGMEASTVAGNNALAYWQLALDGVGQGNELEIQAGAASGATGVFASAPPSAFVWDLTGVAAGSHTIKMQQRGGFAGVQAQTRGHNFVVEEWDE